MESPLYEPAPAGLKVIETLRFEPDTGFARLALHMDRAERTCAALGFGFERGACLQALGEAVGDAPLRVRLTVDRAGGVVVTTGTLALRDGPWRIALSDQRLRSGDPWLAVKTTRRALYDQTRAAMPDAVDEVIFLNERGEVCEGTISNVFVEQNGKLLTPLQSCGLLPGVLRQELLESGRAVEKVLHREDIKDAATALFVGNSLRGLIRAAPAHGGGRGLTLFQNDQS